MVGGEGGGGVNAKKFGHKKGQTIHYLKMVRFSKKIDKNVLGPNFSSSMHTPFTHLLSLASLLFEDVFPNFVNVECPEKKRK